MSVGRRDVPSALEGIRLRSMGSVRADCGRGRSGGKLQKHRPTDRAVRRRLNLAFDYGRLAPLKIGVSQGPSLVVGGAGGAGGVGGRTSTWAGLQFGVAPSPGTNSGGLNRFSNSSVRGGTVGFATESKNPLRSPTTWPILAPPRAPAGSTDPPMASATAKTPRGWRSFVCISDTSKASGAPHRATLRLNVRWMAIPRGRAPGAVQADCGPLTRHRWPLAGLFEP